MSAESSGSSGSSGASSETQVDPVITDAVEHVSNRFGTQGLCDLIAVAREELARAEAALKQLDPDDR